MKDAILELQDAWKRYSNGRTTTEALRGVTLSFGAGESVALTGPSGAGKSTLLYLLGLMDTPSSGRLRLLGKDPFALPDRERSRLRGRAIGFVFQSYNLLPQLKAWENVALPLKYSGAALRERKKRALEGLERVDLLSRADHYPSELSGGQEQRVAIARALIQKPELVLADEPTGNLDTGTGERVLALLTELHAQGATLITVTHSPQVASRAERTLHLVDGRIVDRVDGHTEKSLEPTGKENDSLRV